MLAHLVHPIQIACKAMPIVKPMKTHYAQLFDPELFPKIFCVAAVCDVLVKAFDEGKGSAYIEPKVRDRRDTAKSVRPDVAPSSVSRDEPSDRILFALADGAALPEPADVSGLSLSSSDSKSAAHEVHTVSIPHMACAKFGVPHLKCRQPV